MSNYFSFSMPLFISLVVFAALLPSPALSTSLDNNNKVHKQEAAIDQLAATLTGNEGEYLVDTLIGTPSTRLSLVLDTDSDLIWSANCRKTSTSYSKLPCNSDLCTKAKGSCDKSKRACQYKYTSTNLTTFQVDLATETFTFEDSFTVPKLAFACAAVESAPGGLGLGRGPLSLVSQMKARKLSYCLPEYDYPDKEGFLYVGSLAKSHPKMITTSLVKNPSINPSAYYIAVEAISVGKTRLPIKTSAFQINSENGSGGFVMDIGSTMTYLNEIIFNPLQNELKRQISLKPTTISNIDLPVCYITPSDTNISLPIITLHFSPSSKLTLSLGNTFREYTDTTKKQNVTCLAMAVAPYSDHGMSSLGNIQLQNTLVFMDLAKQTVEFLPNTECDTVK